MTQRGSTETQLIPCGARGTTHSTCWTSPPECRSGAFHRAPVLPDLKNVIL